MQGNSSIRSKLTSTSNDSGDVGLVSPAERPNGNRRKQMAGSALGEANQSIGRSCCACDKLIQDKYVLRACNKFWHEQCLKCDRCHERLIDLGSSLYEKAEMKLCRQDYHDLFGHRAMCSVCDKTIFASEMVMRAKANVYHLECFACQLCGLRFCVGERFYLCENKIVCQFDYDEHIVPIEKSLFNWDQQQQQQQLLQTHYQALDHDAQPNGGAYEGERRRALTTTVSPIAQCPSPAIGATCSSSLAIEGAQSAGDCGAVWSEPEGAHCALADPDQCHRCADDGDDDNTHRTGACFLDEKQNREEKSLADCEQPDTLSAAEEMVAGHHEKDQEAEKD